MKIKKVLFAMSMIAVISAGLMALSAFTALKQDKTQVAMNDDDGWKVYKVNVPYCDADKDVCEGYGKVWINNETYQIAFQPNSSESKFDLGEYTKKEGYNMRFWYNSKYHYVNLFIPRAAFE